PGLRRGEERGQARALLGVDVAHPLPLEAFGRVRARLGALQAEWGVGSTYWLGGAEAAVIWRTPLGLLELSYGRAADGRDRFAIRFGTGS
ncbi:MAG: hypothetical protein ACRELD_14705, partial [Longimicrobiales bacterium]